MNKQLHLIFSVILYLLTGFSAALLSSLLIYFKQKEFVHHGVVLISVFTIYILYYFFREKLKKPSKLIKLTSLIFMVLICWLAPQFIYQIRPYTFYISGFIIGCISIIALANSVSDDSHVKFPWNYVLFFTGYIATSFLSTAELQYLNIGFASIVMMFGIVYIPAKWLHKALAVIAFVLISMVYWRFSTPLTYFEEQSDYEDKIVFAAETQFHELVVTQWHEDHWFFIDRLKNLSSIDEYLYYEPMAHSVLKVANHSDEVLIIGGENGCLIREVLKNDEVKSIDVISYDTLLRNLGKENNYFIAMNQNSYNAKKVHIIHEDMLRYISTPTKKYDAVFIDLPDPKSMETNQYYTIEFYNSIRKLLTEDGVMITQAGSPYFATQAFYAIGQTIQAAGFNVLPIHNQILTLGEWGWYICSVVQSPAELKERLVRQKEFSFETKWFNDEAAYLISSFGKTHNDTLNVQINSLENPLVYKYYLKGNWDLN